MNELIEEIEEHKNDNEILFLVEENKKLNSLLNEKRMNTENLENDIRISENELQSLNIENNKLKEQFYEGFSKRGFCC